MPKLVRLYIRQVIIGYLLSAVFVTLLLSLNVANLWHLVTHTSGGWIAVAMLFIFNGVVFAGVQFGIAIMRMSEDDSDAGRGKRIAFATPSVPQDGRIAVRVDEQTS
ncbi:hypothetical protein [Aliiruegeria lutimaris]|uniref:Uncharacterized protein n=1 Tax=Aliiruegeria lutimaris TaxID=571298 RepID=A0A1G8XQS5_9RHOB|nr:hypothetical protein [Aliiruegeria lutimaris]SDJ92554.1 hypothetical protein SAMN04488026_10272 [Aliiruegeria lutimaris]